ncbi:MAG TPA: aminomethyltransferase beta-barrel domain-containing protein, partial [Candidatus Limnocylindrales bacterium]|nr:aminomethyltransferase beta-barrel domain-containing protein [Candidatus Limnocylindrales bacterium]
RIGRDEAGTYTLMTSLDPAKDQSYVLCVMGQEQLKHALFPIGEFEKPDVRRMAERFGLPTASKQDSQDLCFLGDGDYRRFLRENAPETMIAGPIVRRDGAVIGQHEGLANYTIGQRKGLGLHAAEPVYVIGMNLLTNVLVVGTADELGGRMLTARRVNWVAGAPPAGPFRAEVKIRYKARPALATVEPLDEGRIRVSFDEQLRDITPGQGAVVYQGEVCLGGGIIERA